MWSGRRDNAAIPAFWEAPSLPFTMKRFHTLSRSYQKAPWIEPSAWATHHTSLWSGRRDNAAMPASLEAPPAPLTRSARFHGSPAVQDATYTQPSSPTQNTSIWLESRDIAATPLTFAAFSGEFGSANSTGCHCRTSASITTSNRHQQGLHERLGGIDASGSSWLYT